MSTSLLYHAFGIREYKYVCTEYHEGHTIFTIKKDRFSLRCPCCYGKNVVRHGASLRWFHALPIGGRATYIKAHIPKVECKDCQSNRQIKIGFGDSRFTFTSASVQGVSVDMLRHVLHYYIREETLKAASADIVNQHH